MASSLSEDEFHRMQLQLIELRTAKYELEGKNRKVERDLIEANEKLVALDKELSKSKQAINKSKKAKDVELLLQESDSLQRKLQSQEEEFRLQNQTLMSELAMLVASNEDLKKQVETSQLSSKDGGPPQDVSANTEEIRRLQAENAALQKNLKALQERCDRETVSSSPKDNTPPTSPDRETASGTAEEDKQHSEHNVDAPSMSVSTSLSMDHLEKINELQLQLDTEQEEKRLIKEQFEQTTAESKEQLQTLQDELEKAADKLKKKQESYMQLHAEKEALFKETSGQITQLQESQNRDSKRHAEQIAKLQHQLEKNKVEVENQHASSERQAGDLQQRLEDLQREMNKAEVLANQQLSEQAARHAAECDVYREKVATITKEKGDLETQLQEAVKASTEAISGLQAAQAERDVQITALQEANKVAEKRKALLDELAIKYQKEYDNHRENVASVEEKRKEEADKYMEEIEAQKKTITQLNRQLPLIEELNKKVASLEESKGWLERRLSEVEEQLSSEHSSHKEELSELINKHREEMDRLKDEHTNEMEREKEDRQKAEEEWRVKEEALQEDLKSLKNKSNHLKQEILDSEDKKKIHERKGMTMMKDLKRQLQAERRRAEKLQNKLQEVLADSHNKSMDDLFKSPDSEKNFGDTSSVSSWGASASGVGKDSVASGPQSPVSGNSHPSEASVGDEYNDLLRRVALLQQEKWALEEKVNHLEMSNACMADDILNKASIIEHYVMESRSGRKSRDGVLSPASNSPNKPHLWEKEEKSGLQKVIDLVNNKTGHTNNNDDMNRKLQAMLEETLTKNMHLQQGLELMSQEVVRLSKLSATHTMDGRDAAKSGDVTEMTTSGGGVRKKKCTAGPPASLNLNSSAATQRSDLECSEIEKSQPPSNSATDSKQTEKFPLAIDSECSKTENSSSPAVDVIASKSERGECSEINHGPPVDAQHSSSADFSKTSDIPGCSDTVSGVIVRGEGNINSEGSVAATNNHAESS